MSDLKYCVFDIETCPSQTLPDDLRPQPDMSKVKYGNTKNAFDRMKIEAAYVEDFNSKLDKTMSLDPYYCQVVVIGMMDSWTSDLTALAATNESEESAMLQVF